ncbi:hypothetical protein [Arthrobacter monumenti]
MPPEQAKFLQDALARLSRLKRVMRKLATGEDSESGSAVIEFIFLGTLLLVPVVYLVLAVGSLQGGSYASVGAAHQAAKVFVSSESPETGKLRAERAAMLAVTDHGFEPSSVTMEIVCNGEKCLEPGSMVTVHISVEVPLPLMPSMPALDLSAASVSASATEIVERFG